MTTEVLLPKLGFAMNEGNLAEWYVKDGDTVQEGDLLYGLESDKSVQEIEAPASGVVTIIAEVGETYEVGALLARIG